LQPKASIRTDTNRCSLSPSLNKGDKAPKAGLWISLFFELFLYFRSKNLRHFVALFGSWRQTPSMPYQYKRSPLTQDEANRIELYGAFDFQKFSEIETMPSKTVRLVMVHAKEKVQSPPLSPP